MDTKSVGSVIPFPAGELWSRVAAKYVEYVLSGDPRAGCYYLEHELHVLKLSRFPVALRDAIRREYGRRGIRDEVQWHW